MLVEDTEKGVRAWVVQTANSLQEKVKEMTSRKDAEEDVTSSVSGQLKAIAAKIAAGEWTSAQSLFQLLLPLREIFTESAMGVSAFELHSSGLAGALSAFFRGDVTNDDVTWEMQVRVAVYVLFGGPQPRGLEECHVTDNMPAVVMVRRLNEALAKYEKLPMNVSDAAATRGANGIRST